MDRTQLSREKFNELFGEFPTIDSKDPELMEILQKFIFGEVFYVGDLEDSLRELVTVVLLAVQQTLPQLKAHTEAALRIGVTPIEIKEAIYQCAPFIGFPKTLNAVNAINEVFEEQGIALPLPSQKQVTEEERFEKGKAIQTPIYGDEIQQAHQDLPENLKTVVPNFLTAVGFGDFYTRSGLSLQTRELLILCMLVANGQEKQILAHAKGNLKVGNSKEVLLATMIHCLPYIGFPNVLNAISIINKS